MRHTFKVLLFLKCLCIILLFHWFNTKTVKRTIYNSFWGINQEQNFAGDLKLKYILQWTNPETIPFIYMGKGRNGFIERNCPYTNCFVTSDKNLLGDYKKFEVIAFAGPQINYRILPKVRSPHQKYAYASLESGDYYPICNEMFNNYFNWTWTFKLDSDVRWGYLTIRDKENKVIGPNKDMNWIKIEDMKPVSEELKIKLKKKTKAAAWFVSNCRSRSKRENYVRKLQKTLKRYNLTVDIYGKCGPLKCPNTKIADCNQLIQDEYHFYLAFENSFAEDYVTEKLGRAMMNNAVPIVFGGANYTRFLPRGSYLNAMELDVHNLAKTIYMLMRNPELYFNYFKWQNHYSYNLRDATIDTNAYCGFCALLNNKELVNQKFSYENFVEWWSPPGRC